MRTAAEIPATQRAEVLLPTEGPDQEPLSPKTPHEYHYIHTQHILIQ